MIEFVLKTLSMGKQPVYYVQKSYRNEDGKPSTKYVERLGTLEDLEKRFGEEDPTGEKFSPDQIIGTLQDMKSIIASVKTSKDEKDNDEA